MDKQAWHERYRQQAAWSAGLREFAYRQVNLAAAGRVLEVGCGTGAVLGELTGKVHGQAFGVDLDLSGLRLAQRNAPQSRLTGADGLRLPFAAGTFDATLCHFFLLWVREAGAAVAEMARVTRPGGYVLALAEPDYGGRVDYPPDLEEIGRQQAQALRRQGADPHLGRKLPTLLVGAGLKDARGGVLGGEWSGLLQENTWENEWRVLEDDLSGVLAGEELARLRAIDREAWRQGRRVLFVPTFYSWGRV